MSQEGVIDIIGTHPEIPIEFVTNFGSAVPIANVLEVLGEVVAAGSNPFRSIGSGNTITYEVQTSQAINATDATKIGLAAFNSAQFSVDPNGFVSLAGGGLAIDSITPNDGTIPVFPDSNGNVSMVGTATNGIKTIGSTNTLTIGMNSPYADGSFAFSRSASGSTNTLTVSNTSNTASSNALQQVTVAGTSAGDPATTYTVSGTTNWTMGIDNSVSGDPFVLASSTALGTSNVMSVATNGSITVNSTSTATQLTFNNRQLDTNAASDSVVKATIANGGLADPFLLVGVEATTTYAWGIDNSDSDSLKITQDANDATPSVSNVLWKMTSGGIRTIPLQPAFLAYLNAVQSNVTGDGTVYTVPFNTEVFDRAGNFASNTFTAPVTGIYQFHVTVTATNIVVGNTDMIVNLVTTGRTFQLSSISAGKTFETQSGSNTLLVNGGIITAMNAGDTATVTMTIFGGTKTVGVFSGINLTNFSGCLLF